METNDQLYSNYIDNTNIDDLLKKISTLIFEGKFENLNHLANSRLYIIFQNDHLCEQFAYKLIEGTSPLCSNTISLLSKFTLSKSFFKYFTGKFYFIFLRISDFNELNNLTEVIMNSAFYALDFREEVFIGMILSLLNLQNTKNVIDNKNSSNDESSKKYIPEKKSDYFIKFLTQKIDDFSQFKFSIERVKDLIDEQISPEMRLHELVNFIINRLSENYIKNKENYEAFLTDYKTKFYSIKYSKTPQNLESLFKSIENKSMLLSLRFIVLNEQNSQINDIFLNKCFECLEFNENDFFLIFQENMHFISKSNGLFEKFVQKIKWIDKSAEVVVSVFSIAVKNNLIKLQKCQLSDIFFNSIIQKIFIDSIDVNFCILALKIFDFEFVKIQKKQNKNNQNLKISRESFYRKVILLLCSCPIVSKKDIIFFFEQFLRENGDKIETWIEYLYFLKYSKSDFSSILKLIKRCYLFCKSEQKAQFLEKFYFEYKNIVFSTFDEKSSDFKKEVDVLIKDIDLIRQKESILIASKLDIIKNFENVKSDSSIIIPKLNISEINVSENMKKVDIEKFNVEEKNNKLFEKSEKLEKVEVIKNKIDKKCEEPAVLKVPAFFTVYLGNLPLETEHIDIENLV